MPPASEISTRLSSSTPGPLASFGASSGASSLLSLSPAAGVFVEDLGGRFGVRRGELEAGLVVTVEAMNRLPPELCATPLFDCELLWAAALS